MHLVKTRRVSMQKYTYREKLLISLKEMLTIKDICILNDCSTLKAMEIRKRAIEHRQKENPDYDPPYVRIDAEAVFAVIGHDSNYYLKKMKLEKIALE